MRVSTNQHPGFLDKLVSIPESNYDLLSGLIDWHEISRHLELAKGDYDPLSLFKMMLIQTWQHMSDQSVADAVGRDLVYMKFCGFSLEGAKPDASTLCRFRNRLVAQGLVDKLLLTINNSLNANGLKLSDGKYVSSDATLIQSARRPRKRYESKEAEPDTYEPTEMEYSDDRDASWVKKGDKFVYGYSATVTTDELGMVEAVSSYPANKSEMGRFPDSINDANLKPGQKVLYDKGASSKTNQAFLKENKLRDGIMRKKPKGKAMSHWNRLRNKLISRRRFVTERTFGTLKRTYGLSRARYLGLVKIHAEVIVKSVAYNLKRALNYFIKSRDYCVQN